MICVVSCHHHNFRPLPEGTAIHKAHTRCLSLNFIMIGFSHSLIRTVYLPLSHLMAISPPTLSLPLTQCLLDFLSCLSHSFPIITSPLYAFCHLLSVHLLASFFSLLPRGSAFNTGIRGQALNIFHLVMPRGGHHPGFVVLTH